MNPLAKLKEKLMIKPNVEERERVAVVIKGVKKEFSKLIRGLFIILNLIVFLK